MTHLFFLLSFAVLFLQPLSLQAFAFDKRSDLVVENRVLTKVNEKTISVLDVIKTMDVFISRYYPDLPQSKVALCQFYSAHWKDTLNQIINNELIIADAESRGVKVTDSEVREEIQNRFGPNVMETIGKIGISYEETRKIIHQDLVSQRMNWLRVSSKALQKVTSTEIKKAYKDFLVKNPPKKELQYQILSIRCDDVEKSRLLSKRAFELLTDASKDLNKAASVLKTESPEEKLSITVSTDYQIEEKSLVQSLLPVLSNLSSGEFSPPIEQKSRDGSTVYRIFHLKNTIHTAPPKFEEIASELKDELLKQAMEQESVSYVKKLRERFGYEESSLNLPANFEPFSIR